MFAALAQPFQENPPNPQALKPFENQNFPQITQNAPAPKQNFNAFEQPNFQLADIFPDMSEDPLSDDHFLEAINKIERENAQAMTPQSPQTGAVNIQPNAQPTQQKFSNITSNYVQNVNRNMPLPQMFFPNSNVTINYNFNAK